MNSTVNEITKSITGKTALKDCTTDELRQITGQYPYFSSVQFLYTKKLKEENSFQLQEQIEKASLYFQNPVWFHSLLHEPVPHDGSYGEESVLPGKETEMEPPSTFEEVVDQTRTPKEEEPLPIQEQPFVNEAIEPEEKPLPQFKFQPVDPNKAAMTFEPYHTIDYFASQGIKPKEEEEEKPKDQFSRQLKSFTEWLKTMKRLPASEIAANVSPTDEKKVEQMAQVSINDREVVTEAMAEVWEKQGNREKAMKTYEKLSLLDPAKSSYFAAKIEHLKNL